ncbi:MAG TPA: hypothetical protein VIP77_22505 [Jiangellaceae bacterium]
MGELEAVCTMVNTWFGVLEQSTGRSAASVRSLGAAFKERGLTKTYKEAEQVVAELVSVRARRILTQRDTFATHVDRLKDLGQEASTSALRAELDSLTMDLSNANDEVFVVKDSLQVNRGKTEVLFREVPSLPSTLTLFDAAIQHSDDTSDHIQQLETDVDTMVKWLESQ